MLSSWSNILSGQPPDTLWTKFYGDVGWEEGYSVKETFDGGYIITGEKYIPTTDGYDLFLLKTDANGDSIWMRTYGGQYCDGGFCVVQCRDSGYIACGITMLDSINHTEIFLVKVDKNGNLQWSRTYGGTDYDEGRCVIEITDGYIVAGSTTSYGNSWDAFLMEVDTLGNSVWFKKYDCSGDDVVFSVKQINDNGFIIAGQTTMNETADILLIKTDPEGDTIWIRNYGRNGFDSGYSVTVSSNGDYVATGFTDSLGNWDVCLLRVTPDGDLIWFKTYGGENDEVGSAVMETRNGNIVIAGGTNSYGAGSTDVYLIKVDPNGNLVWQTTYGGGGDEEAYAIQKTSDNGYVICGYIDTLGTTENRDIYLIKTVQDTLAIEEKDIVYEGNQRPVLKVIPNPFHDKVAISLFNYNGLELTEIKAINIYDVAGRLVRVLPFSKCIEWNGMDQNNEKLNDGVYFCVLHFSDWRLVSKIILVK